MGEDRRTERVLERWPCGCRVWRIETLVGGAVEGDEVERQKMCRELESLVEREERAQQRAIAALVEHGDRSPEHNRATMVHADLLGKIEEHYNDSMPTVEVLNEE